MLENATYSLKLHDFLRNELTVILDDWREISKLEISASRNLSDTQQRNKIPEMLESIAASSNQVSLSKKRADFPKKWPKLHAQQRWDLGFSLEETTREYALLRSVIFERLKPRIHEVILEELAFLNKALDESIIESVISYVEKANQRLASERERLEVTLQCIGDGVVTTDPDGKINYMNPAAQSILGYSLETALGQQVNNIMHTLDESTKQRLKCAAQNAIEKDRMTHRGPDIFLKRADGELISAEETAAPIRNASGELMGAVTTFRDISKVKALTQRLGYATAHDALTGLPNRTMFVNQLYKYLKYAEHNAVNVAVFHIDLDRFKDTNDMLGRADGDLLLSKVGKRLASCIGQKDYICRAESDEFIIFAEIKNKESVTKLCEKLHENIRRTFIIHSKEIHISASLGISVYPEDGPDLHSLLMHAETATKQAKAEGRNISKFFTVLMNQHDKERRQLQVNLKKALVKDQFSLHFQPQISLTSGRVVGAEALLRWTHPSMGQISPGRFIPVAEQHGDLMIEIGDWVLSRVCHQLRTWQDAGYAPLRISVNVSLVQLRHDALLKRVSELLKTYQLPADTLQLEITESLLMAHFEGAIDRISALKSSGVDISVDDFGTGYSSLSYLQDLPVDELKIDQSFLKGIISNHEKKAIVKAIISLGESLNIRILAEGVEDLLTADYLKENGCEIAQGFLYSKAISPDMFEAQYLSLH